MQRLLGSLALGVVLTLAQPTDALAQCQTTPLPLGTDQPGALDPSDCLVNPLRNSPGEYWTIAVTAGDFIAVSMRRQSMFDPYLYVLSPSGAIVAEDDDNDGIFPWFGDALATFTAATTGEYRIVATHWVRVPSTDYGTYTIRAERVTTPTAPEFTTVLVTGSQVDLRWSTSISPTAVLEYVLEVGSISGSANLGVFTLGTGTRVLASAAQGTYFVRVRARNATGFGAYSAERQIVVGPELSAPTFLTASVAGRRVTLSWFAPVTPGVEYYELVVGTAPGLSNFGTLVVGLNRSVSFDNVPVGAYYVRVRAGNIRGPGAQSNEVVVIVF